MPTIKEINVFLDRLETEPFLNRQDGTEYSFPKLIRSEGPFAMREAVACLDRLRICAEMVPILGIVGGKNAGKSTLVSALLSYENKGRCLVGANAGQDTNRFIVWAPISWKVYPEKNRWLRNWLRIAFGHEPEDLPLEEESARKAAYTMDEAGIGLDTPLLAFDGNLDRLNLAVMDCPDIETAHGYLWTSAEMATRIRREALTRACRICSAFVLVQNRSSINTEIFRSFFQDILPPNEFSGPYFLLVTRTTNNARSGNWKSDVDKNLGGIEKRHSISKVYHSPLSPDPKGEIAYLDAENHPVDFSHFAAELAESFSQQQILLKSLKELSTHLQDITSRAHSERSKSTHKRDKINNSILHYLEKSFVDENNQLRNLYTPEMGHALFVAYYNTAPKFIKVNLAPVKWVKDIGKLLKNFTDSIEVLTSLSENLENILKNRGQKTHKPKPVASADTFAVHMKSCEVIPEGIFEHLPTIFIHAHNWIGEKSMLKSEIDQKDLEEHFREVWKVIKPGQMVWCSMRLLFLLFTIIGLTVASVSLGGPTVLFAMSLNELFVSVLPLAIAAVPLQNLSRLIEDKVTRPQISCFFAALQDGFALFRSKDEELAHYSHNKILRIVAVPESKMPRMKPVVEIIPGMMNLSPKAYDLEKWLQELTVQQEGEIE